MKCVCLDGTVAHATLHGVRARASGTMGDRKHGTISLARAGRKRVKKYVVARAAGRGNQKGSDEQADLCSGWRADEWLQQHSRGSSRVGEARQAVVVEARWRALAKQLHPDVPGGSDDRFREMRAHYEVLMED